MTSGTSLERLARLEEQMAYAREDLGELKAMAAETRDAVKSAQATASGGWKVLGLLYPPLSAAVIVVAGYFGLPIKLN